MKQNIENIIAENSVETTNKEYGNGIFISTDAISDIAQGIVKLFAIPRVTKRFFSWGDILIGFIAGVFGTIITLAYIF